MKKTSFYVYVCRCADDTLYTGITNDIDRRLKEHNSTAIIQGKGAKYTRARRPVEMVYHRLYGNRSQAMIEEARIKKLSRKQKQDFIHKDIQRPNKVFLC